MPADDWRPLSARSREAAATAFEKLHEGIPPHLVDGLRHWMLDTCLQLKDYGDGDHIAEAFLRDFQVKSHRRILRAGSVRRTLSLLFDDAPGNGEVLLDLLEFTAQFAMSGDLKVLKSILDRGRSAWTVDEESKLLMRRVPGGEEALATIKGLPGAGALLHSAWNKAYGVHADAKAAYDEAIRAVEAAYCSAILPKAHLGTLGTVAKALKEDPSKLRHVWAATDEDGRSGSEVARSLMELLLRQQGWRHGSEGSKDPKAPKEPTLEHARAALHAAMLLITWRTSGSVVPSPKA